MNGWLKTGDLGVISRGRLFVTGRSKELIIKAGKKFHPQSIESVVQEVLGESQLGVVALSLAQPEAGTDGLAVLIETRRAPRPELRGRIEARLQGALGVGIDDLRWVRPGILPRTSSGKIQRRGCLRLLEGRER